MAATQNTHRERTTTSLPLASPEPLRVSAYPTQGSPRLWYSGRLTTDKAATLGVMRRDDQGSVESVFVGRP